MIAKSCALLVIDMQRDFLEAGGYATASGLDIIGLRKPIANIAKLLTLAREKGLTVIHTREGHHPDMHDCPRAKLTRSRSTGAEIGSVGPMGRLLIREEYGHGFIDELMPLPEELIIDKPGYGAFYLTDLAQILHYHEITQLVICGVTTEVCVHSTLREAVDRGFDCILVSDACGSAYEDLHSAALKMVAVEGGIFGQVLNTERVINDFGHNNA